MENWCYDKKTLYGFAKHYSTGEPLPEELFKKIKNAKNFQVITLGRVIHQHIVLLMLLIGWIDDDAPVILRSNGYGIALFQIRCVWYEISV